MTLYEINRQIEETMESCVDPETGEISEEVIQRLSELQMAKDEKVENVALWHKNLLAESKAIADEIKALQERKKSLEKKMQWQENYLEWALEGQKFESPKVAITYRKSTAVEIEDLDKFIAGYKDNPDLVTTKIDYAPNKTNIKAILKEGTQIDGAWLIERQNMQIK